MSVDLAESAIVERLVPELQAEGYEVFLHPQKPLTPMFFGSYSPDLIALRRDRNIAVEVVRPTEKNDAKLNELTRLFADHRDWEFRVLLLNAEQPIILPSLPLEGIAEKLEEINQLIGGGHNEAALLLSWAVFEAAGRSIVPGEFQRPQTPGRAIDVLATMGIITPDEADILRPLAKLRNRLIHGEIDVQVSGADARRFAAILKSVIQHSDLHKGPRM